MIIFKRHIYSDNNKKTTLPYVSNLNLPRINVSEDVRNYSKKSSKKFINNTIDNAIDSYTYNGTSYKLRSAYKTQKKYKKEKKFSENENKKNALLISGGLAGAKLGITGGALLISNENLNEINNKLKFSSNKSKIDELNKKKENNLMNKINKNWNSGKLGKTKVAASILAPILVTSGLTYGGKRLHDNYKKNNKYGNKKKSF